MFLRSLLELVLQGIWKENSIVGNYRETGKFLDSINWERVVNKDDGEWS